MENQIQQYLTQLSANPSDIQAIAGLEEIYEASQGWDDLVSALVGLSEAAASPEACARLLVRAGEVAGLRQGDVERAQELLSQAEAAGAAEAEVDVRLASLALKGDWRSVIELRQQVLTSTESQSDKVYTLCQMGFVFRDRLDDRRNAMKAFQAAFRLDRTCVVALRAARDIYLDVGDWKLVAQLLQFELQALQGQDAPHGEMADSFAMLGDVLREHLGNPDAARNCYDNALKLDAEHDGAQRGLGILNGEPLEEAEEAAAEPEEAVEDDEVIEIEESDDVEEVTEADDAEEVVAEADDAEEAAAEAEEAAAEAEEAAAEAEEAVEDDEVIEIEESDDVEEVVAETEEAEEAVEVEDAEEVEEADEDDEAIEIEEADEVIEVAEADEAEEVVAEADDAEEAAAEAEEAEEAIEIEEVDDVEEVVAEAAEEAVEVVAEAEEADEVAEVEEAAAEVEEAVEGDEVIEIEEAEEVIEVAEADEAQEVVAEAAAAADGDADEADSEGDGVEDVAAEGDAAASWVADAAALASAGDLSSLHAALKLHADNAPGGEGLSSLLATALSQHPSDEGHYEALRDRIDEAGVWPALLAVFEEHLGGASSPEARLSLGRQVGRVKFYELGDLDGARALAEEVEGADSGDLTLELRDAQLASDGKWRRLQQELMSRYEDRGAPAQSVSAYRRLAELGRGLGADDRRLDSLRRLVQEDPSDAEGRRQLKRVYAAVGKWQNYVEILKQEVDIAEDDGAQKKILWEMVTIYKEKLSLDVMVINTYNQLLQIEPENLSALDALAAQYEKMRRYPDLVGALQRRFDVTQGESERIEIQLRIATMFLDKFSNQAEAIKAFEKVLEMDPYHADALKHLKEMYERRREYEKLIDVHEREISRLESAEEKGARYKEVAELATKRLRKPERAAELWHKVLEFNPGDLSALEALEKVYERAKDWEALVGVGERKFDLLEEPKDQIKLAEKMGRIYTDRLSRPDDAARCWRRVLSLDANNRRAQDSLRKLLIEAQDWDGLGEFFEARDDHSTHVRTLEMLAGTVKEHDVKLELLFRAAQVWRDKIGKVDRAVKALEKIQGIDESNLRAAQVLAPIYEEAGDSRKLAGVLEIVLGHLNEEEHPEQMAQTLHRLASLNEDALKNGEVAFLYYARAFALEDLSLDAGEVSEDVDVDVEAEGDGEAEPDEASVGDEPVEGEEVDADDIEVVEARDAFGDLERVAGALGAWDDLVGVYQDKLEALRDSTSAEAVCEVQLRLGRVLNEELGRSEDALTYYEQVLGVFPGELRALSAQEAIFQKTGDWARLMEVYDRKLALTQEATARVDILQAKAQILEMNQEAYHDAIECHLEVLELSEDNFDALVSLHRLYEQIEDYPALAGIIRQEARLVQQGPIDKGVDGHPMSAQEAVEAGVVGDEEALEQLIVLKHQLGIVASTVLPEAAEEAVACFRDVLAVQPDNDDALERLEFYLEDPSLALDVSNTLEPFYAETARWEALVGAREIQLASMEPDLSEEREAKLLSIGEILSGRLGDLERAFEAYGRALRERPGSAVALEKLEQIAEAIDQWAALVSLWEDITLGLTDPDETHAYQTRVAHALEGQVRDMVRAQEAWRRVLELEPEDEQALGHLEELTMNAQQWPELDEIYTRMLALWQSRAESEEAEHGEVSEATAAQVQGLLFKQAMLHQDMLDDASGAIEIYKVILEDDPENLRACRAMDLLLGVEGRHDELARNIEQQLSLIDDGQERLELKCRLASLKERELYEIPGAIVLYGEVLGEAPSQPDALEALDRLLRAEPDHQQAIAAILEPLYQDSAQWEKLIEVLEILLSSAQDVERQVGLLHRISNLNEAQLERHEDAFEAMIRALHVDVRNEDSMAGAYRLAAQTMRHAELVDALESEVAGTMDLELGAALNMRIAALQENELEDVGGATDHYRRVLEVSPEHLEALGHLERIFTATSQWRELVEVLQRKVPLTEEVADQKELLYRAATLFDEFMGSPPEAIEVYERVLTLDEGDGASIDQLERLYQGSERWLDLIELYRRKLGLAQDDASRRMLYFQSGEVYETCLEDAHQAIDTYRQVLELDAGDGEALMRLDRLYSATEQWNELLEILERRLTLVTEPSEGLGLRHRVGALWEQHLGDPVRAVEVYKAILSEAPDFVATLDALEGMIERGEEQAAAAQVLRPIYFDNQQWPRLVELYEILVATSEEPEAQAGLLKEIGQLQELRLGDGPAAFGAFGRALRLAPEDEGVLETLERLASELDGWEALVSLLEEQLGELHDMDLARSLSLRIGRILEEEVFDRSRAIERFQLVLDMDPSDETALTSLDRLYQQEGRWEELANILQERILQEDADEPRRELRYRLGKVYETALEDAPQAINAYREIMMGDPENADARQALEGMFGEGQAPMEIGEILAPWYEERERWGELVNVYEAQLEHREDADERFAQLHQIAQIYMERLGARTQAFASLGRAQVERPGDEGTSEQLEALAAELDAWPELAGFYADALERAEMLDDQQRLLLGVAKIMDERLGDVTSAEEAYLRVLDMDDADQTALGALDRIYEQQARWPELAHVVQREIELSMDEEKVVTLSYRLGMLFEHQLGNLDMAVDTYNKLLEIEPTHNGALQALEGIYQMREEWQPLFDIYQRQADLLDEDQRAQAEVYAKMASLADQMLMRSLDAIDLWNRVLDLRGEDLVALQEVAQLYEREEQWSELVQTLERQVAVTLDPMAQVGLWSKAGQIWHTHLLNDDQALEAFQHVLVLDPTNVHALYACRDLHQRMGNYESLVDIIDQLIMEESLTNEQQLELYVQLGEIQGNLLRNVSEAVKAWTAVLSLEPTHKLALDSLEELYIEGEQWEACVSILERKSELLEAEAERRYGHLSEEVIEEVYDEELLNEQIDLQLRIAELWEQKIGSADQAVSAYEALMELDPGHEQASRSLEGLYNDREDWDKLVELLVLRKEYIEDDPFTATEILRRAASITEEQLGDKGKAFLLLCGAFIENSEDEATADELERLARETGEWETLINLYYNILEEMGDTPESLLLHIKIAAWWADELGNRDRAIEHYRQALELSPDNTQVMAALEDIYEKGAQWEDLIQIMTLRAQMTVEDDTQMAIYRKMGDVLDNALQDPARAIEAYRTILRIDASDVAALESLEGIYERHEEWPQLIEVLERKTEVIFEPDVVVGIKFHIAQLWEEKVGSVERAVEAHRSVLSVEPTHTPSLDALERLYRHLEKWFDLQEVYQQQLTMAGEPSEQVAVQIKSAQVFEEEMGDVESAVETYGQALLTDMHNLHAIEQLERLYTDLQRWDDLLQILERHTESVMDSGVKVEVYHRMGQVCREHLGDLGRAIDAYRQVLSLDPTNLEALYELAQLYEASSDWENCLAVYETLASVITDPEAGVEVHYRMGRIKEENLLDAESAEERYKFALELNPAYKPALDALRDLYHRREDWPNVIAMLRQEEEYTRDLEAKAELLCTIGQIYEHHMQDEIRALDYYKQTIDLAPENVLAAEPLSRMYLREQRWARAWPLLDLLVRHHGHDRSREDLYMLHYNLGRCCEELGQDERALKEYGESYEFNPNHLPTLMGMGRLMYRRDELDRAFKVFRTITRHHAETLSDAELTDIHGQCGNIQRRLGNFDEAVQMYEAAVQSSPDHKPSLESLVSLNSEMARWDHVVAYKERLMGLVEEPVEQYAALSEIGDILNDHLGNPAAAVEAYRRALEVNPDSVAVLRKLLNIYTQSQMWTDAVQVLIRISDLEQDAGRKGKYCYTIAVIFRDEIGDVARAVEFFNRSLDNDLSQLKAFEAIDRLLTEARAWKDLERSYRKMLHRVKGMPMTPELEGLNMLLWKNLGEIFRSRQGNYEAAIEAYKVAVALRPEDTETHEILADLYERSGKHPEAAIEEHKRLIKMKPFRIESYRALFNSYMKTQRYDEAWCMASALTFLQNASAKEQEFYQNYLGAGPANPNRALTPEHWKAIYHHSQDMLISNIMALIAAYMRERYYAFDHKQWSLHKRRDLLNLNQPIPFCRIYQWTAQTLSLNPAPNVYLKRDHMAPMQNANLSPPAYIVGQSMFQNMPDREVAFIVGKQLALGRPEHYLSAGFFPTANLKLLFMAAMQLSNPQLGLAQGNQPLIDTVAAMQRILPPPVMLQLRNFMQQFFKTGANPNLSAWRKAIDHTTDRVGLLMCGDLLTAANTLRNDQVPISKLDVKDRVKELVLFSISEEYFHLRKDLGLALRAQ